MDHTENLVRQAVAGDADSMTRLLNQFGPEVERGLSIGREWRSVLEPADVMQVTYFEAFLQIAHYDPDRSEPFSNWLRRIAENNLRDAIRGLQSHKRPQPRNRIEPRQDADSTDNLIAALGMTSTTPSGLAQRQERTDRLQAAIDALPEDYGLAVRLYDLQGLAIDDLAKRMNRSGGAVHMLRARAHDRLRELLGAESKWFSTIS